METEGHEDRERRWIDSPLVRAGLSAYALALGALLVAVALTRDTVAGIATGPDLTSVEHYDLGLVITAIEIPLWWLPALPIGIALLGVTISARPLLRALRTEYVLTPETLVIRTRRVRENAVRTLPLEHVVETTCNQSLLGRLASYGTVTFNTSKTEFPSVRCHGIQNPQQVHQIVLELDASPESPLERKREYIRVVPATGERAPEEIADQVTSLHTLGTRSTGRSNRFSPFSRRDPPTFEFITYSNGTDDPIEFYYTADTDLDALEQRLSSIYPASAEIERTTVDPTAKLISPQRYSYDEFETALDNRELRCSPEEVDALRTVQQRRRDRHQSQDAAEPTNATEDVHAEDNTASPVGLPTSEIDAEQLTAAELRTLDIDTPVDTGDGVLARSAVSEVDPFGVRWTGSGDRLLPIKRFTDSTDIDRRATDPSHAPLTALIDALVNADHPIAFQVLFEREPDWTAIKDAKKEKIREGRDGPLRAIATELGNIAAAAGSNPHDQNQHQRSSTRRRSESARSANNDDPRLSEIDEKDAAHSFTVNARVSTVPDATTDEQYDERDVKQFLRTLSSVFDPLEGRYYKLTGEPLHDNGYWLRTNRARARRSLTRLLDREIATSGSRLTPWRNRPDLLLDADELSNLIVVPSTDHLTPEATKETHARQDSRTPLPGLDAAQRQQFTTGMELGVDSNSVVESPLCLPPALQPLHWLLCAATGSGKTQLILRALRSLAESTPGPNVLIDRKGDGMCLDYLMAHYKHFGSLEDVYYFRQPETLPAISFFDIRPALEAGHDRETAVKEKADHFHELMRMIMTGDQHQQAFVANEILSFLIYALFDPVHGDDVFGFDELVEAATAMQHERTLPELSAINDDIHDALASQFDKDDHQFHSSMGAVLNRLNRLKEARHLHWMLRHTPGREPEGNDVFGFHEQETHFDFAELLDEDVTILFDLGDLTQDAQRGFGIVLLSNLWHAIQHRQREQTENVVNVILEEAAPFVATELVTDQLLPQARSTGVSLGLVMQYPEQVKRWEGGAGAYEELLTDVHTKIIGNISITPRLAASLTHDELSSEEIRNRVNRMASGEWLVHLASPAFGEDRPAPLTMHSLPIVSGHPESDEPLTTGEQQRFEGKALPEVIERTDDEYGLYVPTHEDAMEWSNWSATHRRAGTPLKPESDDEANEADATDDEPVDVATGAGFFDPSADDEECPVPDDELRKRGLSRDDAIFLKRVLDAMNRELPEYSLLEGMSELREDLEGLDTHMLIEQGLLEKAMVNRHTYYTVLPAGRKLLGETLTAEEGVGDLGEKTPHKVGVELLVRWLETLEKVDRVERYYQQSSETVFDVVAFDADNELVWVGEVEMASNNTEAVVTDYEKMAAVDADAVWAFPSRHEGRETVNVLADAGRLPGTVSGRAGRSLAQIQERVESFEADGMTTVQTLRKLYEKVMNK